MAYPIQQFNQDQEILFHISWFSARADCFVMEKSGIKRNQTKKPGANPAYMEIAYRSSIFSADVQELFEPFSISWSIEAEAISLFHSE